MLEILSETERAFDRTQVRARFALQQSPHRTQGVWAFGLLAGLDRVLHADTTAILRQLMRRHLAAVARVCAVPCLVALQSIHHRRSRGPTSWAPTCSSCTSSVATSDSLICFGSL
jgi:hypothetical protein